MLDAGCNIIKICIFLSAIPLIVSPFFINEKIGYPQQVYPFNLLIIRYHLIKSLSCSPFVQKTSRIGQKMLNSGHIPDLKGKIFGKSENSIFGLIYN